MIENAVRRREDLELFFDPQSIAIIGASKDFNKPGGLPIDLLRRYNYAGKIYPINPRYSEIVDIKCYPSAMDIPDQIDLAIIAVPVEGVMDAFIQCVDKKIKAVIIFTAGLGEIGGEGLALQQQIVELAKKYGMLILGPNCFGLINFNNSVLASFARLDNTPPVSPKSLAFVSQSGGYAVLGCNHSLQQRVGFGTFVSVGNEANLEMTDFMDYILDDPKITVLGGYLEGAKNGPKLRRVAEKAVQKRKPLLMIKVGSSKAGARAANAHTGSQTGDDSVYDAFFDQMGIIRIDNLPDMSNFVTIHRCGRAPKGRNVAFLTVSGGFGVLATDRCEALGLKVPEIVGETRRKLDEIIPFFGSARNPVDITAPGGQDVDLVDKCIRIILADDNIDTLIVGLGFSAKFGEVVARNIVDAYKDTDKTVILLSCGFDVNKINDIKKPLLEQGIPIIDDTLLGIQALYNNVRYYEKLRQMETRDSVQQDTSNVLDTDLESIRKILSSETPLTDSQSKQILEAYGIPYQQGLSGSGVEVRIDTTKDSVFGPVIKFGLASSLAEAIDDVSLRIAPIHTQDAEDMIRQIKGYPVLASMLGNSQVSFEALSKVLLKVSNLVTQFQNEINRLDINSLIVYPDGLKIVDALIVKE